MDGMAIECMVSKDELKVLLIYLVLFHFMVNLIKIRSSVCQ